VALVLGSVYVCGSRSNNNHNNNGGLDQQKRISKEVQRSTAVAAYVKEDAPTAAVSGTGRTYVLFCWCGNCWAYIAQEITCSNHCHG
jgi:hypothetical protein